MPVAKAAATTYLQPVTLLAHALFGLVVADACAPTYLAQTCTRPFCGPRQLMLAYQRSAALALATVVLADAGAPSYLALAVQGVNGLNWLC